jgi:putative colanic acid biosysnthesis UDP-glucose lipid carrier transferase
MQHIIALILLLIFMPILIIISILVFLKIDKRILFIQKRIGLNNKVFNCYKFATMMNNGDYKGNLPSNKENFRINKYGFFLRKFHLDELAQLVNIIKGEMNFIGPRPHSIYDDKLFNSLLNNYYLRHEIKPGITGLAQCRGLNGPIIDKISLKKRLKFDLYYIQKKNFLLDVQIILNTIFYFFFKKKK